MRGTRWLLLVAILAISAGIGVIYHLQKSALTKQSPAKPAMLPPRLAGVRSNFIYEHRTEDRLTATISADSVKQEKESNLVQLENVELHIMSRDEATYDLVKSASAQFNQSESHLYSDGAVEITLHMPADGKPTHTPVTIKTSGVDFEVKTGKASTDRAVEFNFEGGTGKALGASYDPTTRDLHLRNQPELHWTASSPHAKPMTIQAGDLVYNEAASKVWLYQWSRLTRENTVVDSGPSVVQLQDQAIHQVDTVNARGVDEYPKRKLQYAADELRATYNDYGEIERVSGKHHARLVTTSDGAETTMTSDVVDMDFDTLNDESVLKKVLAYGDAAAESKPHAGSDGKTAETRILRSQMIELDMRPGGREIEVVRTHAPGTLDFLPNQPDQHRRHVDAERMTMTYGPSNTIQSFRAINVKTETEPTGEERARKHAQVSKTRSQNLSAEFDPKTAQVKHMEQWDGFFYEEGDRRARASQAQLDADRNLMTLQTAARLWDSTGVTSADVIHIDQKTGDFAAEGHVTSSQKPDQKKSPSAMLSGDEPMEAVADQMSSQNHNRLLRYNGHVALWQGADRITADQVEIDRDKRALNASGAVVTQFLEKRREPAADSTDARSRSIGATAVASASNPPAPDKTAAAAPIFVTVKASNLVYTDQDRLAHYTGGAILTRPLLVVKADELRAVLTENKKDDKDEKKETDDDQSRIEKAYADGHVEIVQTAPDRTRTGTSEHAEYYTDNERIVLRGGQPQMLDSKRGYTRGVELTYFVNDDRLLVAGGPKQRATGLLRRKSP